MTAEVHRLTQSADAALARRRPPPAPGLLLELAPIDPPNDWRHHRAVPQPADPRAFGQLPTAVLRDLELTDGAVRLFAELACHAWRERTSWLGRPAGVVRGVTAAQLAANIGATRRTVMRSLVLLEERRHIVRPPDPRLVVLVFGLQL